MSTGYALTAHEETVHERASAVTRTLMAMRGETQQTIRPLLGISTASLSDRMTGATRWTLDDIERLARHYDVSPALFFAGPDELLARVQNLKLMSGPKLRVIDGKGTGSAATRQPPLLHLV